MCAAPAPVEGVVAREPRTVVEQDALRAWAVLLKVAGDLGKHPRRRRHGPSAGPRLRLCQLWGRLRHELAAHMHGPTEEVDVVDEEALGLTGPQADVSTQDDRHPELGRGGLEEPVELGTRRDE